MDFATNFSGSNAAAPGMNQHKNKPNLTPKETEVVKKIMEGYTTKEISALMNISINTVFNHRRSIYKKTGSRNVAGLINYMSRKKGNSG